MKLIVFFVCVIFSSHVFSGWKVDERGTPYVSRSSGNTDFAMADIVRTVNGVKQIILRFKPLLQSSCRPQGVKNGDNGYLVKTKLFINDTLIYAKKFIEVTGDNGCFIYYSGYEKADKRVIVDAFRLGVQVAVEIDGAPEKFATKYRGETVVVVGGSVSGKPLTIQRVLDSHGQENLMVTVPTSQVRWVIFPTAGFDSAWESVM